MKKILLLSRYHNDDDNSIYNAFIKGISKVRDVYFIDYFDTYSMLGKADFEKEVNNILVENGIDQIFIMFVSGDVTLDINFLQKICTDRYVYMTFWDLEQFYEPIDRYYAQLADTVILPTNNEFRELFKMVDIEAIWTFSIFDSQKYNLDLSRDIDVSFIGEVNKGNRKGFLKYLVDNGLNVQIYGSGSDNGKVSFSKMVEILNRSKISLNFSDTYDNSIYSFCKKFNNRIKQTKGKVVEVCMSGAFLLTEESNSLNELLDINNIDLFNSKEELLEKITYYLHDNKERIKKSTSAQKEVLTKYDVEAISEILDRKNQYPKIKKLYIDNIFLKIYRTFHFFYFIEYMHRGLFKNAYQELKIFYKGILYIESINYIKKYTMDSINRTINKYLTKQKFYTNLKNIREYKNNSFILYPAGDETRLLLENLELSSMINIIGIADQNISLKDTNLTGIKIIHTEDIPKNSNIIITNSNATPSIKVKLEEMNLNLKIYSIYDDIDIDSNKIFNIFTRQSIFWKKRLDIYKTYRKIFNYK